jgi:large subunit ribosomal protein L31
MKQGIHPTVFETKVTCSSCGDSFVVSSTTPTLNIEVCSNCHPLFTGIEKFIDTEGRIEKFQRRMAIKVEPKKKETVQKAEQPRSLREMLEEVRDATTDQ